MAWKSWLKAACSDALGSGPSSARRAAKTPSCTLAWGCSITSSAAVSAAPREAHRPRCEGFWQRLAGAQRRSPLANLPSSRRRGRARVRRDHRGPRTRATPGRRAPGAGTADRIARRTGLACGGTGRRRPPEPLCRGDRSIGFRHGPGRSGSEPVERPRGASPRACGASSPRCRGRARK